jgi:hypothetical protein
VPVCLAAAAVRSYRTVSPLPDPGLRRAIGGLLSVALFRVLPRMAVSHHPALWSPDFPRPRWPKPQRPRLPGLLCWRDFNISGGDGFERMNQTCGDVDMQEAD